MKNRVLPFGYEVKDGTIVVVPNEAEIIKTIFKKYISGQTLIEIADSLTRDKVDFFNGNTTWNKGKVSRLLVDERYCGDDKYPKIINKDVLDAASAKRAEKGNAKAELSPLITIIKQKMICSECGNSFSRRNKYNSREKWLCIGGCKCQKYLEDKSICDSIMALLNMAIVNPSVLTSNSEQTEYSPSAEVVRQTNEINRMIDRQDIEQKRVIDAILSCAAQRYTECRNNGGCSISSVIRDEFSNMTQLSELDESLIKRFIERITVSPKGNFTLYLKGNIILTDIEKEHDYGTDSTESGNED